MPLPRKNQDEFFISSINNMFIGNTSNEAIIYQPYDPSSQFLRFGTNIENFEDFISHIIEIFSDVANINPDDSSLLNLMTSIWNRFVLENYLRDFLRSNRRSDIVSLTHDFYVDIRRNTTIQNILGVEKTRQLVEAILDYYNNLVQKQNDEKGKSVKKANFSIQFKEFKVLQSYIGMEKNKEIRNIIIKKYITNRSIKRKKRIFGKFLGITCFFQKITEPKIFLYN
ncbi:hypothetical protein M9Y10_016068 [Tritrichomonas musculus]|uniref:Uncharacterized protein n=1 Tax=Tritrichomonas musculus TaxID=1915356 RepID=A0ABR2I5I5_9EUKA